MSSSSEKRSEASDMEVSDSSELATEGAYSCFRGDEERGLAFLSDCFTEFSDRLGARRLSDNGCRARLSFSGSRILIAAAGILVGRTLCLGVAGRSSVTGTARDGLDSLRDRDGTAV